MKKEALSKLEGLEQFQFFIWSKTRFQDGSDADLLSAFHKRFDGALPLKHLDMVLMTNLKIKK